MEGIFEIGKRGEKKTARKRTAKREERRRELGNYLYQHGLGECSMQNQKPLNQHGCSSIVFVHMLSL